MNRKPNDFVWWSFSWTIFISMIKNIEPFIVFQFKFHFFSFIFLIGFCKAVLVWVPDLIKVFWVEEFGSFVPRKWFHFHIHIIFIAWFVLWRFPIWWHYLLKIKDNVDEILFHSNLNQWIGFMKTMNHIMKRSVRFS